MIPFYTRFPELGPRETRCIHVLSADGPLPIGRYDFLELYCEDPGCDCRRVLVQVSMPQAPQTALATINFGWESAEFYTQKLHGDTQAGREITEASLDPLNPQSEYAEYLLDYFRERLMADPGYVANLARHYEMFKAWPRTPARPKARPTAAPAAAPPPAALTTADILRQLQRVPGQADFASYKTALLAAIEHREAITPELIAAIDQASANPEHFKTHPEDCLYLFAIYLLAQFREPQALEAFLRFFALPGELPFDLSGEMITHNGAAVLASVCGGDPAPLLRLAHNEAVNEFVRSEAIRALAVQALWGERPREAVVEDLRRLFHTLPKPGDGIVWAELAGLVCDFQVPELADEARRAFTEGLVDQTIIDLKWFEQEMRAPNQGFSGLRERNTPVDAVSECSAWICFRDEESDDAQWGDPALDLALPEYAEPPRSLEDYVPPPQPTPYIAPPKVGRNDPCPCGSGRKFKKCCGK